MPTPSAYRVPAHTDKRVNAAIRERTDRSVAYFRNHPEEVERRRRELDREWDVERTLEAMSACFSLVGLALGVTRDRRFLVIPCVVQTFFLQHALQGWCPPLPVLRRLGFRTIEEIQRERRAIATEGAPG
jgi:hypothetical protein